MADTLASALPVLALFLVLPLDLIDVLTKGAVKRVISAGRVLTTARRRDAIRRFFCVFRDVASAARREYHDRSEP